VSESKPQIGERISPHRWAPGWLALCSVIDGRRSVSRAAVEAAARGGRSRSLSLRARGAGARLRPASGGGLPRSRRLVARSVGYVNGGLGKGRWSGGSSLASRPARRPWGCESGCSRRPSGESRIDLRPVDVPAVGHPCPRAIGSLALALVEALVSAPWVARSDRRAAPGRAGDQSGCGGLGLACRDRWWAIRAQRACRRPRLRAARIRWPRPSCSSSGVT
jgi:hypothetical protein